MQPTSAFSKLFPAQAPEKNRLWLKRSVSISTSSNLAPTRGNDFSFLKDVQNLGYSPGNREKLKWHRTSSQRSRAATAARRWGCKSSPKRHRSEKREGEVGFRLTSPRTHSYKL